jgi:anti-sigma regulatory factor (Ser/Thr protein kinase)
LEFLRRGGRGEVGGGLISGLRGIGKTDLIHRTIPVFSKSESTALLFYYQVLPYTLGIFDLARSYFNTIIRQYHYYHRGEAVNLQECVDAWYSDAPQCKECREPVMREICEAMGRAYLQADVSNVLSFLVNVPGYLGELNGHRCIVVLDHARYLRQVHFQGHSVPLLRQLQAKLESPQSPLFLVDSPVALRTLLGEQAAEDRVAVFDVARVDENESLAMFQTLCERSGVALSLRVAEHMGAQLGGLPFYVHSLVRRAHLSGLALDSTERFGQVYAQEIRDGAIHWYWRAQFSTQFPLASDRQKAAELCSYLAGEHPHRAKLAGLPGRLALEPARLQEMITHLQMIGVLDCSYGAVGLVDDPVLRDVATVLAWGESSATTDAELLRRLAARRVRTASTPPLEETIGEFLTRLEHLLEIFHGQYLPGEWFHYREGYGAGWGGLKGDRRSFGSSATLVRVPCLTAVSRLPSPPAETMKTKSRPFLICGSGFRDRQLTPGNETVWLAVIWPAANPVDVNEVNETVRLRDELARQTGHEVRHTWLIGRAALTREARQMCAVSRLFSGNMDTVDFIHDQMFAEGSPWREALEPPPAAPDKIVVNGEMARPVAQVVETYLPVNASPESAAAGIADDFARSVGFPAARISQLKLAVLEAATHAAKAGTEPSQMIYLRCTASPEQIEIVIRSRGRFSSLRPPRPSASVEAGPPAQTANGLNMVYILADEVAIRAIEEGTEIQLSFRTEAPSGQAEASAGAPE